MIAELQDKEYEYTLSITLAPVDFDRLGGLGLTDEDYQELAHRVFRAIIDRHIHDERIKATDSFEHERLEMDQ